MPRKKKVEFQLSEESFRDLKYLRLYEPFLPLHLFKLRIMSLTGYRFLRLQMASATEEDWTDVYRQYKDGVFKK